MLNTYSQRTLFYLFILSIFVTILAWEYWKFFFMLPLVFGFWWLTDVLYFEDGMFMYETNYDFWREENDTEW